MGLMHGAWSFIVAGLKSISESADRTLSVKYPLVIVLTLFGHLLVHS